ncbi:hypothetical protein HXX01_04800 [Candidatus Nomurabacteria bacterium]|nr:hypothetical protein [Candidatus Nomurabacteria bacterium]
MLKNKIFNFIIFTLFVGVLFFTSLSVKAETTDQTLPDNVKITTSSDGTSTTVVIDGKPGYYTSVQTSCENNKCTHTTSSKKITEQDIKTEEDNTKKRQEALDKFWKMQEELFQQQQKLFQDLWGFSLF